MAIKFKSLTKHGAAQFLPNVPLGFEDAALEAFLISAYGAEKTKEEPIYTYPADEIQCGSGLGAFDPQTRNNETGKLVVSDLVQKGL